MAEAFSIPRLPVLWKRMPADRRTQAAEAFWRDPNAASEQAEAIALIAQRLKFRTKTLMGLSAAKKAQYLIGLASVSDIVAARLLVAYHIEYQRPMMSAFLDALGVAHDNGLIADTTVVPKEAEKIRSAVGAIAASFGAEDVALYLSTLSWQDPETWGVLADLPESRLPEAL